jgi:cyclic pyranopterin phosphate synthase
MPVSIPIELKPEGPDPVRDRFRRPLRELRLSVIDRCNFRCSYCMPADSLHGQGVFLPLDRLLTDHEIERLVHAFVSLGVEKVRITGGEPLIRPGLPALIAAISNIDGIRDIALTTNGVLLPRLAEDLREAGLHRITVSLDSLDQDVLTQMSGGKARLEDILDGIAAAQAAGFQRLKINTVVQKGVNDHTILALLDYFRGSGHSVRLIEFMDVGNSNHWDRNHVVASSEWVQRIGERWPLEPLERRRNSETARRYAYGDGAGEVGFISSITEPFCGGCSRARITAEGILYTCLFANKGTHLAPLLRQNDDARPLADRISDAWREREDRYSELRGARASDDEPARPKVEMYRMGG